MEFKHIEYFIKASHFKSMSKAAESMYISQQALGKCMQNLETELGCRLFERTSKGSTLTDEGRYLYEKFLPVVESYYKAQDEALARLSTQPQKVTIANSPWLFGLLFPDLLFKFKEKYPNIELDLFDRSDTEVLQYVLENPAHLGLITEPEHWHGRHTHFSTVKTYALQLCLHKDHPLAKRESVSFGDLKDEKFLLLDKRSFYQQIVKEKSEEYGFKANIAYETADIHQLCSLADNNKGILICIPVTPHNLFHNLTFVPFSEKDMTFSVAFIFQNYDKLSEPEQRFMEFMKRSVVEEV